VRVSPDGSVLALILAVLEQQGARIDHHDALFAGLARQRHDPDRDGRRLSVLAATYGARVFGADEVVQLLGLPDARHVGAFPKRTRAHPIPPYGVHREGRDARGALWRVSIEG
jgi:hypothetical protein